MSFHHDASTTTSLAAVLFLAFHVVAPELRALGPSILGWPRRVRGRLALQPQDALMREPA